MNRYRSVSIFKEATRKKVNTNKNRKTTNKKRRCRKVRKQKGGISENTNSKRRVKKSTKRRKRRRTVRKQIGGGGISKRDMCKAKLLFGGGLQKNLKCFAMGDDESFNLTKKLNEPIPDSCNETLRLSNKKCGNCVTPSYLEIMEQLSMDTYGVAGSHAVTVFGGAVRDYIHFNFKRTDVLNDIDINYRKPWGEVVELFNTTPYNCLNKELDETKKYIMVGSKTAAEYLEGFNIMPRAYSYLNLESRCNSISIVVSESPMIIVDFFDGKAIEDAKRNHYCAPFIDKELTTENLTLWVSAPNQDKLLWRMLKFANRGYTIDESTANIIYAYWWKNKESTGNHATEVKWKKIWKVLKYEHANAIFGPNGIMEDGLKLLAGNEGIPTYDEMIQLLVQKKYIHINEQGEINPIIGV